MLISLTGHLLPNSPPPSVYFNLHIVQVVSQRYSFRKPHLTVLLFFNWRKITLQCCVGFCYTTTQISHNYTYITSLLSLPPLPPSHPSRSSQSTQLGSLCYIATSHQLPILYMVIPNTGIQPSSSVLEADSLLPNPPGKSSVCVSMLPPPLVPLSPSPAVSTNPFSISESPFLPRKQTHQYHFSSFHLC